MRKDLDTEENPNMRLIMKLHLIRVDACQPDSYWPAECMKDNTEEISSNLVKHIRANRLNQ